MTRPARVTGTADLTSATAAAASSLLISVGATTYTVAVTSGATLANIEAEVNGTTGLGQLWRSDRNRRRQRASGAYC